MNASGGDVSNRTFLIPRAGKAAYVGSVARWRDAETQQLLPSTARPTVSVVDEAFVMPQLGRTRRVTVYLPPDYVTSEKTYPVLYMHDGQNVFDAATSFAGEWGVDETLDQLHSEGDWGAIVVAVDHGNERRLNEYSPWVHHRHGGGEGDQYLEFIVETLKPYIDASFRTRPDRFHTGIAGSSMGGLISLYAGLKYPHVFGRAGVFSPALWFAPQIFSYARNAEPLRPDPRFFFVSGALETAPGEQAAAYLRDQRRMIDTLAAAGFTIGTEVHSLIHADGRHSEWFWRREFPNAYRWLFGDVSDESRK